ncbi:peptidase C39 [Elizabethkingia anophelis]|uniref:peptidase domain-containing ABC transporter n=1 Tax=Elizabethkingia anophelis TaxID=1117645 RepID=UPI0021A70F8B|nr:ATP-binding cassette domain-containing protein [Elizabethkingia anophelis]MCT3947645.1 ATP-binding cassette domain-containing protein [Elizabethkingia anophelis]MDV3573472.1 peptidase C39 [Elizabethkingia anophelis]MDV3601330.1 peptidase C39 [Elizabethkingia anophelis]MDV3608605.1 peptidase C39 [Elizabethkingia anophelis]
MKRNKKIYKTFRVVDHQGDCGIVCLESMVRYYGGDPVLEDLGKSIVTQEITLSGLCDAAISIGFDARVSESDLAALKDHGSAVILSIMRGENYEDYVICYSYENNLFCIGDPRKGVVYWSEDELKGYWLRKECLILTPGDEFVSLGYRNRLKRELFMGLLKNDHQTICVIIFLGVLLTLLGTSMSVFSERLIDDILPQGELKLLIESIGILGFILFSKVLIQALRDFYIINQSKSFNERINFSFFHSLLHLPKVFFDTRNIGDFVSRLNDTQRIQNVIKQLITTTSVDMISILISLSLLFFYSWELSLLCLIISPVIFCIIYSFNKKVVASQHDVMQSYSQNKASYIDSIRGIEVIKKFSKQDSFVSKNQNFFIFFQSKMYELGLLNMRITFTSGIAMVAFFLLILFFSSYRVLGNEMKMGELMAIIGISNTFLASVTSLSLVSISIQEAKVAFDRMFEYSSLKPERLEGIALKEIKSIKVQAIDFRYQGRGKLLEGISFSLERGRVSILLGRSGNGKSTIAEILQNNYKPESGNILINGVYNLDDISLSSWRNLVGVVPQDTQLFNGSILENIVLEDKVNDTRLNLLLEDYGFGNFIFSLPQGIETLVGEEGINLSGGQRQLLGWMRALYHEPDFLILDEPTSSLDKESRKFICRLISQLKATKTIFIISHYLEDLQGVSDEIMILRNKVIESFNESLTKT